MVRLTNEERLQKFIEAGFRPVKLPCTKWTDVQVECLECGHTVLSRGVPIKNNCKKCKRLADKVIKK